MKPSLFACLVAAACNGSNTLGNVPELDAADPPSAGANATVVLEGQDLCGISGACQSASINVKFANSSQDIQYEGSTTTTIMFIIPAFVPEGPTDVYVEVNNEASNELPFTVTPG